MPEKAILIDMNYELEVIAFDIESCKIAAANGADRIELCANPSEGGTTPSLGMIREARKSTDIQLFPIIRPRGGDFLYSDAEFRAMIHDINICKSEGCDGVVIGMLLKDGNVDADRCSELVYHASGLQITFHRAFDRVSDPIKSLEAVISLGCHRILTSGLHPTAMDGIEVLSSLTEIAANRIKIMPGSGVRSSNIAALAKITGATAFHSSARLSKTSDMIYNNMQMNELLSKITIDACEVERLRNELNRLN